MGVVRVHIVVWVITWDRMRRVGGNAVTEGARVARGCGRNGRAVRNVRRCVVCSGGWRVFLGAKSTPRSVS
eukprot:3744651-Pleurochrysis_carterae.AAC.1